MFVSRQFAAGYLTIKIIESRNFKMKERFQRFMAGRYGADQLSNTTLVVLVVLMVINMFARTFIINILVLAGLVWIYFRKFSRK